MYICRNVWEYTYGPSLVFRHVAPVTGKAKKVKTANSNTYCADGSVTLVVPAVKKKEVWTRKEQSGETHSK